jgi:hypothetical protein
LIQREQMNSPLFAEVRNYVTVNRMVAGSSPARGANNFNYLRTYFGRELGSKMPRVVTVSSRDHLRDRLAGRSETRFARRERGGEDADQCGCAPPSKSAGGRRTAGVMAEDEGIR